MATQDSGFRADKSAIGLPDSFLAPRRAAHRWSVYFSH